MLQIAEADRIEVLVLVDNVVATLSPVPGCVENEWPRLWRNGLQRLSGTCLCCGANGLSYAITAWQGGTAHTLLFDTRPDQNRTYHAAPSSYYVSGTIC